jgi:putative protease
MVRKPELLSPAGDPERLQMAVRFGADAVYLAGKSYGMRAKCGNFDDQQLREAVAFCHGRNVKVYVTANVLARTEEIRQMPPFLELCQDAGVDAFILGDLGVFKAAEKYAPQVERHISTQMGIVSADTARAWHDLGATRVVLARELSFPEILDIRENIPQELEIEAFVHGAMCVSFSGRCLLSNYLAGRDANHGACAQPCRWKYSLMEERRPGEYFPIEEDDNGTYIMNSRDLCMIDHIPELIDAGIDSFKIEGRAKSSYYAACVTNAYRHGIDAAVAGEPLDPVWRSEVDKISHRHYYQGFYFGQPQQGQFYEDARYIRDWDVVAYVESCDEQGQAVLSQRGRFWKGDTLELLIPGQKPISFQVGDMENAEGESIDYCPHPMMEIHTTLPVQAPEYAILRRQVDEKTAK